MEKSKVSEYFIAYLEENSILPEEIQRATGISVKKLKTGYEEQLTAEEFLELCVYLGIRPESVKEAIWEK